MAGAVTRMELVVSTWRTACDRGGKQETAVATNVADCGGAPRWQWAVACRSLVIGPALIGLSLSRPRAHPSAKWQTHHGHHFATASFLPDAAVDDPKHLHHGLRRRRCGGGTDTETARGKTEAGGGAYLGAAGGAAGGAVVACPPAPPGRRAPPLRGLAAPRLVPGPRPTGLQPRTARPDHAPRPWRARA